MAQSVTTSDIKLAIASAIAEKKAAISELTQALNALTDKSVADVLISRPRGKPSLKSNTYIVKTVKAQPKRGRPVGSKNRNTVVAD